MVFKILIFIYRNDTHSYSDYTLFSKYLSCLKLNYYTFFSPHFTKLLVFHMHELEGIFKDPINSLIS